MDWLRSEPLTLEAEDETTVTLTGALSGSSVHSSASFLHFEQHWITHLLTRRSARPRTLPGHTHMPRTASAFLDGFKLGLARAA
jgi:hypothetical protein